MAAASTNEHYDYAIIGMGIGGLTLGALLAHAGRKVIIFEQHEVPGGYGHTFRKGKFSFCAELHYVWDCGPGERVYQMLEKLGLAQQVTFHRLHPDGFDRIMAPGISTMLAPAAVYPVLPPSSTSPACCTKDSPETRCIIIQ